MEKQVKERSINRDAVTGLKNEISARKALKDMVKNSRRATVFKIALQVFSHYNVVYGYEISDDILRQFGEKVSELLGTCGTVYRLEGAKFGILMETALSDCAAEELYACIKEIGQKQIRIAEYIIPLNLTASAVILQDGGMDATNIRSALDYAITISENDQYGELKIFNGGNGPDTEKIRLLTELHQCILKDSQGFYLCYQPLMDVEAETLTGAEVLLRWKNEEYGEVMPGEFISWIESDPVYQILGKWIIRTALAEVKDILAVKPDFLLNINITASQLQQNDFREMLIEELEQANFPAQQLYLELTERCRDLDYTFLRQEIERFHEYGICISLDDYGTGSSSMVLLKELPIDEVKIDKSFVKNIVENRVDQALVESTVQLARQIGIRSCVEGVETHSISMFLKQNPATYHQGYYYSKPMRIWDIIKLMDEPEEPAQELC